MYFLPQILKKEGPWALGNRYSLSYVFPLAFKINTHYKIPQQEKSDCCDDLAGVRFVRGLWLRTMDLRRECVTLMSAIIANGCSQNTNEKPMAS